MSRSGYSDDAWDYDDGAMWRMIRWRGQVASAIRGKRGQAFLRELRDALDAMPEKRLIYGKLTDGCGGVCALGAVGQHRGMDLLSLERERAEREEDDDLNFANHTLSDKFNIAHALVCELQFENDECALYGCNDTDERRWRIVRNWVERNIR